jgi:hypothetical protein
LTVLRLKTLWSGLVEGKCLSINCRELRPTLVRTVLLKGGLNQMMFLRRLRLVDGKLEELSQAEYCRGTS